MGRNRGFTWAEIDDRGQCILGYWILLYSSFLCSFLLGRFLFKLKDSFLMKRGYNENLLKWDVFCDLELI